MSRHLWPHTVAETDSTVLVQESYFLKSLRKINQNPQLLQYIILNVIFNNDKK